LSTLSQLRATRTRQRNRLVALRKILDEQRELLSQSIEEFYNLEKELKLTTKAIRILERPKNFSQK
jgi:hypothetical protein